MSILDWNTGSAQSTKEIFTTSHHVLESSESMCKIFAVKNLISFPYKIILEGHYLKFHFKSIQYKTDTNSIMDLPIFHINSYLVITRIPA